MNDFFPETLTLTKSGRWLANGDEITHEKTKLAFSKHLVRTDTGFEIQIGRETKPVMVEDTMYFVIKILGTQKSGFTLTLNDERKIPLDPTTLNYEPSKLTCLVPTAWQGENLSKKPLEIARFLHSPYHELLSLTQETGQGLEIVIQNQTKLLLR